nr:immunoglobulin heavy chain junction region [Mus musculus]
CARWDYFYAMDYW